MAKKLFLHFVYYLIIIIHDNSGIQWVKVEKMFHQFLVWQDICELVIKGANIHLENGHSKLVAKIQRQLSWYVVFTGNFKHGTWKKTSEGWKAELTLVPPTGFEPGTPGLEIQHLNHYLQLKLHNTYMSTYLPNYC